MKFIKKGPFYGELVEYMSSGPIVAAILEKENAVADFRDSNWQLTNPEEADEGTIRKVFAESLNQKMRCMVLIQMRMRKLNPIFILVQIRTILVIISFSIISLLTFVYLLILFRFFDKTIRLRTTDADFTFIINLPFLKDKSICLYISSGFSLV